MGIKGISVESIIGLVGFAIIVSASIGFDPLKAWFGTRSHGFWIWLVNVMSEQLWVGFWVGWWWSIYCGNRLFESMLFGGGVAILAHAIHEVLTYLSAVANRSAKALLHDRVQQPRPRPAPMPNYRNPKLSEEEAHTIMDDYDKHDPNGPHDVN